MPNLSYIDGNYYNYYDSKIHINDRGYHFGDAVYEVILYNQGVFYDFDEHINRLFRSLHSIDIQFSISKKTIELIVKNLIRLNKISFGSVYIQVSRGIADRNHTFNNLNIKPILTIITSKKHNNINNDIIGVKAITVRDNRWARPDIKTTQLLPNVLAKTKANKQGAYESIFIDDEGYVTEGSSSNIWIINKDNEIITRSIDGKILSGITRKTIAKFSKLNDLTVIENKFSKDEMLNAKEVFLTSASSFVTPITEIDNVKINKGVVGEMSIKLKKLYFKNFENL
ncbi:aminotransferase class IV [Alphaproteobacteria bacterium]|jgi:D-alanine transaminase|nr:aminotransferase class IV [Alphaproteobacteria bacterium]